MEDNKNRRYQDNGCSFVVEVQPSYQNEEPEANKGSTDDVTAEVTDQQALVHREEIPEDRAPGLFLFLTKQFLFFRDEKFHGSYKRNYICIYCNVQTSLIS